MVKRALVLVACLYCLPAAAQITIDAVPGGVVEIPLGPVSEEPPQEAYFGQRRVLVTASGPDWVGIVGLPLSLVPGHYVVRTGIDDNEDPVAYEFTVFPRRIREKPVIEQPDLIPATQPGDLPWRESLDTELPLLPPLAAAARPLFGRHYQESNGESRYLDFVIFKVTSDTSVSAPGGGRAHRLETRPGGSFLWIDHGMGLFTRTGPLTSTTLEPGDTLEPGQSVGRIVLDTADRAVTLYWSIFLNGTAVSPFLLSDLDKAPLEGPGPESALE